MICCLLVILNKGLLIYKNTCSVKFKIYSWWWGFNMIGPLN